MWITWAFGNVISMGSVSTANMFSCCLVWDTGQCCPAAFSGCRGLKTISAFKLVQPCTCEEIWLVFLLFLLLHDKCSPLYFYYYTECRHFQTSRGRSCNSPCSSVNPVCWPTVELGVLFPSYYFKIKWKTNHSNHFEIKSPPQSQQLKTQAKPLYSAWLEKKITKSQ